LTALASSDNIIHGDTPVLVSVTIFVKAVIFSPFDRHEELPPQRPGFMTNRGMQLVFVHAVILYDTCPHVAMLNGAE
jgi:hypothetical protein